MADPLGRIERDELAETLENYAALVAEVDEGTAHVIRLILAERSGHIRGAEIARATRERDIAAAREAAVQAVLDDLAALIPDLPQMDDESMVHHGDFSHSAALQCDYCTGYPHARCVFDYVLRALIERHTHTHPTPRRRTVADPLETTDQMLALMDDLRDAGVEVGSVGGAMFRFHVANFLLKRGYGLVAVAHEAGRAEGRANLDAKEAERRAQQRLATAEMGRANEAVEKYRTLQAAIEAKCVEWTADPDVDAGLIWELRAVNPDGSQALRAVKAEAAAKALEDAADALPLFVATPHLSGRNFLRARAAAIRTGSDSADLVVDDAPPSAYWSANRSHSGPTTGSDLDGQTEQEKR